MHKVFVDTYGAALFVVSTALNLCQHATTKVSVDVEEKRVTILNSTRLWGPVSQSKDLMDCVQKKKKKKKKTATDLTQNG